MKHSRRGSRRQKSHLTSALSFLPDLLMISIMAASSSCTTLEDLEKYRIPIPKSALRGESKETSPGKDGFFYLPNFVSQEEEAYLVDKINTAPIPKWKNLQHRRLQYWGGQVSARNTLIAEPMPSWMESYPALVERIGQTQAFVDTAHQQPNHCVSGSRGRFGVVSLS